MSDVTQCQMYSVSDVMYEGILSVNPGISVPLMCLYPASLEDVALAKLITPLRVQSTYPAHKNAQLCCIRPSHWSVSLHQLDFTLML